MNAPTTIPVDTAPCRYIIVLEADPIDTDMRQRISLSAAFYQRKMLPTVIVSASILGLVVIVAQLGKWIAS